MVWLADFYVTVFKWKSFDSVFGQFLVYLHCVLTVDNLLANSWLADKLPTNDEGAIVHYYHYYHKFESWQQKASKTIKTLSSNDESLEVFQICYLL